MGLAKLDTYDYVILPGVIQIRLDSTVDPTLVDVMSEIANADNRIYLEGCRYVYLDKYEIVKEQNGAYLELHVMYEIA